MAKTSSRRRGDVATGRRFRRQITLRLARAQLAGGVPWGEVVVGRCSLFVCQKCDEEYHLRGDAEACAFCDDCKDDVLAILAEAVVLGARARRGRRSVR